MKIFFFLLSAFILVWCNKQVVENNVELSINKYFECLSEDISLERNMSVNEFKENYTITYKQSLQDEIYYSVLDEEWKQPVWTSELINTYEIAIQATINRQNTEKQLSELNIKLWKEIVEEHKTRRDCKTSKQCIDN